MLSIYLGFDPREAAAYAVTRQSIREFSQHIPVRGLVLDDLRKKGLYWRPTERRMNRLYDVISEHEMATEFAISRFLVPHLELSGPKRLGRWALFMDCDMLVRVNLMRVIEGLDESKAVYCVKHNHVPDYIEKMDGQIQSKYDRKNWSSFVLFNCDHKANKALTPEFVNTKPGRELHGFCWLSDDLIGELPVEWNWLVGHSDERVVPKVVHFTDGGPWFGAFTNVPYADEWRSILNRWAS